MITKEQFWEAYNKYPPTEIEEFYFRFFSTNTKPEDRWITWVIFGIFFIPFIIGMIGTMANASEALIWTSTIALAGLLVPFSLAWIYIWFAHNFRIRKIRKLLGVSRKEYNQLADMYS